MKDMTKRAVLLLLALAVLVACAACGGGGGTPASADNSGAETAQTSDVGETPETDKTEEQPVTPPETTETVDAETLFNQGDAAFNAGDYDKAINCWEQAVAQGHLGALSNLATLYQNESAGHLDYAKSREYFERLGDGYAFLQLGQIYLFARGVDRDSEKAREYFEKAAASDHDWAASYALFYLGQMYEAGDGVPQDYAKALEYYQKAVEKGYAEGAAAKVAELQAKLNG